MAAQDEPGALSWSRTSATLVLLALSPRIAGGGAVDCPSTTLTASDAGFFDNFGFSVATSGEVVVVGAIWADEPTLDEGAAYVFRRSGDRWIEEQKLVASDGEVQDTLARSVAVDCNFALLGANNSDGIVAGAGSAYVFRFDGQQ